MNPGFPTDLLDQTQLTQIQLIHYLQAVGVPPDSISQLLKKDESSIYGSRYSKNTYFWTPESFLSEDYFDRELPLPPPSTKSDSLLSDSDPLPGMPVQSQVKFGSGT